MVATLVELADNLVDNYDIIDILTLLSNRCVETVDVSSAGVMLCLPGGELQFVAASSESMQLLELFQIQANEGPCVDCYNDGVAIVNRELVDPDDLWPNFTPRALGQGFRSVHCLPMRLRGRTIGALNLFHSQIGPLSENDIMVAQGLADVATIAILQHQSVLGARLLNDQLSFALNSRIVIEQAKGMVAQFAGSDMEDSFLRLRNHARNHNLKLTELAGRIVDGSVALEDVDSPR